MKPIVAARTDVGRVRQGNEDSYLVQEPLFAVADGMGGHLGGEVASATAVETITAGSSESSPHDTSALARMVKSANSAIWEKAKGDPDLRGMGTTCTLALVENGTLHIAHVGDSRAYLLRSEELKQLTEDHTLVSRMVQEGRLAPEEAERHPQRSIITRALGAESDVEVDEISTPLQEGDRVLLCSDGLTSMIDAGAVHEVLSRQRDPEAAVEELIEQALQAGGEDNVTVVLIDVVEDGAQPTPAPAAARPEETRQRTEPDAVEAPAPPAVDTGVHRIEEIPQSEAGASEPRRRGGRRLLIGLLLVLLLVGAAFGAARYTLANSYFVGTDGSGRITIYRGIPEEIAGVTLKEPEEQSGVALDDLPGFLRADVEQGIKTDSLDDARDTVATLEERAQDTDFDKRRTRENSN